MASKIGLSYRRERVIDRFRHEANRARARGVEVGSFPHAKRGDPESRALDEITYAADLLAAVVDRLDELSAAATEDQGYEAWTVKQLTAALIDAKVEIPKRARKGDLIALLTAAEAAPQGEADEGDPARAGTTPVSAIDGPGATEDAETDEAPSGEADAASDAKTGPS